MGRAQGEGSCEQAGERRVGELPAANQVSRVDKGKQEENAHDREPDEEDRADGKPIPDGGPDRP